MEQGQETPWRKINLHDGTSLCRLGPREVRDTREVSITEKKEFGKRHEGNGEMKACAKDQTVYLE